MTEEWVDRVAKECARLHGATIWEANPKKHTHGFHARIEWVKATRCVLKCLEDGVPREQIAGEAAAAYNEREGNGHASETWESYTTFIITEYLLTAKHND